MKTNGHPSFFIVAIALAVGLLTSSAATYLNETGLPGEADSATLQFPVSMSLSPGQTTPSTYGQIFEAGLTEPFGPHPAITADIGYGPANTDPRTDPNWHWFGAAYNAQVGNSDEYVGSFTINTPGAYSYTFRYSLDGGSSFTLGDLDGAGSIAGLDFSTSQLGALSVVPEPGALSLGFLGLAVLAFAARLKHRAG